MNDWMIFAERLSVQIKKQNLSIRQLAERMDMTPTTISRYAKGQRVPRGSEIVKAADALGVTCDYLIGLSDDPKKTSRSSAEPERKKDEWIPCSEKLPSKADHRGDMVLVCYRNGSIRFNTYMNGWVQGNPVAWMPLPEPYKGEQDDI